MFEENKQNNIFYRENIFYIIYKIYFIVLLNKNVKIYKITFIVLFKKDEILYQEIRFFSSFLYFFLYQNNTHTDTNIFLIVIHIDSRNVC